MDGIFKWGKWREFNKRLFIKVGVGKVKGMVLFFKVSNS